MQPSTYEIIAWALSGDTVEHLRKAKKKCRAILSKGPNNAAILQLMGTIELQLGNAGAALEWTQKAMAILPGSAELHCLHARTLAAQKKHAEAVVAFKRAIVLKPDYARAFYGLGAALKECGDEAGAINAYLDALAIEPDYPEALNDLGVLFNTRGALDNAAKYFTHAIAARPDYPLPLNNLGLVRFLQGDIGGAEALYRRALALKPDYPDALNNLGMIYQDRGAFEESASLHRAALAARPDHPDALNNLGTCLLYQGAFSDSAALFKKALAFQPAHSEALNNLGNALKNSGELSEAIATYERAIALKPDHPDYRNNRAMALLAAGRFDEGWPAFEWRWKTGQFADAGQDMSRPQWRGEAAPGRVLLVRAEQGFGDTLQFCRYAPLAAALGMRVVLEVQPALVRLMGPVAGVERVIAQGEPLPDFDFYCAMMSLPAAFNTRLETIPADIPYLSVDPESVKTRQKRLRDVAGKDIKVGLAWAGSSRLNSPDLIAADRRRSIDARALAGLIEIAGVRFFSLQKGGPPAPREFGLVDLMDECGDFFDTAALVANLDLIISVDTAIVHLAGALGRPVWLLNRFDTCWRWLRGRDDSPWYPTLRLFRQPSPGDWESVVLTVGNELRKIGTKGRAVFTQMNHAF
jgi:tetratricopeptide (TPR) repeat protein